MVKAVVVLILRWFVYTVFFSIFDTARLNLFRFKLVRLYLFGQFLIVLSKLLVLFLQLRLLGFILDVSLQHVPALAVPNFLELMIALSFDFFELMIFDF